MIYKQEIPSERYLTLEQMNIINTFQRLWAKIGYWIRIYVRSTVFDSPDKKVITNYLTSLPNEFYSIFNMFFGFEITQNITNLILNFIKSAMKVIEYKSYGESWLANSSITEWYQSADELASYLAKINVYWDENQWKYILYQYIKLKTDDIGSVVNSNYEENIERYNTIDDIVFLMGSYMARGIISLANIQNQS